MSAQVTEAHRELARRIMFEFTQAGTATASDVRMAAQIIADSEAQATAELRGALALGQQNCDDVFEDLRLERDQLRAECNNLHADLDAIKAIRDEETARAERAEAELATERARLDYMSNCGFEHLHNETGDHLGHEWTISSYGGSHDVTLRDVIDAEMEEGRK